MWIFTKYGMLSAVQHRDKKYTLCVRAREPKVLEMFCKRNKIKPCIRKTPTADYMYRMEFNKEKFAEAMLNEVLKIDYPNFKGAACHADKKNTARYHDALMDVWCVMRGEQSAIEYGKRRRKVKSDLNIEDPWFDSPEIVR